jgi:CelD/BcsL family acetyltransferase involved in cellulose biosynthesis
MRVSEITIHVVESFDDPLASPARWDAVLRRGKTDVVFLTWHWQRAWWEAFGRGTLLLIVAERDGETVAIAPLFAEAGMIFFVGSGGSDYLDFIGDISEPVVLDSILNTARHSIPDFLGFRFYHVPDESATGHLLKSAGDRLVLDVFDEGDLRAPMLDFSTPNDSSPTQKKSLQRHEKFFRREGSLEVLHFTEGEKIRPHLKEFFAQHIDRWKRTASPSLFEDLRKQQFYEKLIEIADHTGWLRFTRIDWNGTPIAFHFGTCYRGQYLWYKPSFAVELARHSPGEVLLRQLLLAAQAEHARVFDFGLGDERFKSRFANRVSTVRTWGSYPADLKVA